MLPEVKALLVSPFISYVRFKLEPDTTTQHIITPVIDDYPALKQLSDEALAEIHSMRIIQERIQLDGHGMGEMCIRLVMSDQTVASMLTPLYDDIPSVSVMMSMRGSLLTNRTSHYTQKFTPAY